LNNFIIKKKSLLYILKYHDLVKEDSDIIRRDTLYKLLRSILSPEEMDDNDIRELTEYILKIFGFDDFVVDNMLTPVDRDIFYYLESKGIFKMEEEEVTLYKGKPWRIHYWVFKRDLLKRNNFEKEKKNDEDLKKMYDKIFRDMEKNEY